MKKSELKSIIREAILGLKSNRGIETDLKIYKSELNMINKINPKGDKQLKRKKWVEDKIKELEGNLQENQPAPSRPLETPTIEPGTKPDAPKPRRRTLTPPDDSPTTAPKAESIEKDLANKMASRFKKLK